MTNSQFIVSIIVIKEIFGLAQPLSIYLQGKNVDLSSSLNMCDSLCILLNDMHLYATDKFKELFISAEKIADEV